MPENSLGSRCGAVYQCPPASAEHFVFALGTISAVSPNGARCEPRRAPGLPGDWPLFPFAPFPCTAAALPTEAFSSRLGEKHQSVCGWTLKNFEFPQRGVRLRLIDHRS